MRIPFFNIFQAEGYHLIHLGRLCPSSKQGPTAKAQNRVLYPSRPYDLPVYFNDCPHEVGSIFGKPTPPIQILIGHTPGPLLTEACPHNRIGVPKFSWYRLYTICLESVDWRSPERSPLDLKECCTCLLQPAKSWVHKASWLSFSV